MAYNDEALKAKLATLNETQESIVSVSQWIAFHRRYADRIAQVWLTRLKDSPPPKRLNYVYLVNDIVQNAKARKRSEFPNAFAPIIAEAVQHAYRSSPTDIQGKVKRLLEVWKTRHVFEESILAAVDARVADVDASKPSSGKKTLMGKSLFSGSSSSGLPKELESLAPLQTGLTKADFASKPLVEAAQAEYTTVNDQSVAQPSAPVHAANLSSLIKKLASAEASLTQTVEARKALVADLRRILEANEAALFKDDEELVDITAKRAAAETQKRDVEDSIMRGLAVTQADAENDLPIDDGSRPLYEELTPEPEEQPTFSEDESTQARNPGLQGILAGFGTSDDTLNDTAANGMGPSSSKKRKLSQDHYTAIEGIVPDLGEMGITSYDGAYDMSGALPTSMSHIAPPELTSTLEQDVEALIRANSGGTAG